MLSPLSISERIVGGKENEFFFEGIIYLMDQSPFRMKGRKEKKGKLSPSLKINGRTPSSFNGTRIIGL